MRLNVTVQPSPGGYVIAVNPEVMGVLIAALRTASKTATSVAVKNASGALARSLATEALRATEARVGREPVEEHTNV